MPLFLPTVFFITLILLPDQIRVTFWFYLSQQQSVMDRGAGEVYDFIDMSPDINLRTYNIC